MGILQKYFKKIENHCCNVEFVLNEEQEAKEIWIQFLAMSIEEKLLSYCITLIFYLTFYVQEKSFKMASSSISFSCFTAANMWYAC